jgi:hypothetical protein
VVLKPDGADAVGEGYCRPSGAGKFFGFRTRGLRPGLDAAAPPGLRRAERIGLGIGPRPEIGRPTRRLHPTRARSESSATVRGTLLPSTSRAAGWARVSRKTICARRTKRPRPNDDHETHAQTRRVCSQTPKAFYIEAQGKRSATLGRDAFKSPTLKGLYRHASIPC